MRNQNTFSQEECAIIGTKHICVIGCGGLGGHVIQQFVRFGIGHITIVDGDVFAPSNLNRQLFATEQSLGQKKATIVADEIKKINSDLQITAYECMFDEQNASSIIAHADVVIDCLDNIASRLVLEDACSKHNKVFIHGAIAGVYGQISTVFPKDGTLSLLYKDKKDTANQSLGNPPFTPALVASIQVLEGLKYLSNRPDLLHKKLLFIDLTYYDFDLIDLSDQQT